MAESEDITPFAQMRAPYLNRDGFRFKIYSEGLLDKLGKLFGAADIQVGDPEFGRNFMIKGTDHLKVRSLLANKEIRRLIPAQPSIVLQVIEEPIEWTEPNFPEGVNELHAVVGGEITDVKRLRSLFKLFLETLSHLSHTGSALPPATELRLCSVRQCECFSRSPEKLPRGRYQIAIAR